MNPLFRVPLRLLFPSVCLLCKSDLPFEERRGLCRLCVCSLTPQVHIEYSPSAQLDYVISSAQFGGKIRDLVHLFKYKGKEEFAEPMADLMKTALDQLGGEFDLIVPVPMPFWRKIRRGYNHAEVLAKRVAIRYRLPVGRKTLRKTLWSRAQVHLGRQQRIRSASFTIREGRDAARIRGKRVLLVDDVATTGATLQQCAFLLRSLGAQSVVAVVFARDQHGRRGN